MILYNQLIMTIGKTQNDFEFTREMVENSIGTFKNAPIVWNKKEKFKDYRDNNIENYNNLVVIGVILDEPIISDNNIYANIFIIDKYKDLWKGKFDNWCINLNEDKKSFKLFSIEVF